jgi:hypothetical protein
MQVIDANGNMFGYDSITVAGPDGRPKTLSSAIKLVSLVRNQTGATLTKGTVVYINGGSGNKPTVTKALATSDATSAQTYGVLQADIANNKNGYVVVIGSLEGLNTSAYAPGTQLYLSSTVAGTWTSTKQLAPAHLVYVGIVVRQHVNQGVVEVKIQNGYELDEIHDVQIISPSNGDTIVYNSASQLWKNVPSGGGSTVLVTASPYTPSATDYYIYVDMLTPCVINLPAIASANPSGYNIKNIGESTVKIVPLISEPIDDQAEINIKNAYTSLDIVHTATNWYIV